jgi:hypothetical protein
VVLVYQNVQLKQLAKVTSIKLMQTFVLAVVHVLTHVLPVQLLQTNLGIIFTKKKGSLS